MCPVDCFYEGENMLVIHPDECIDCGVCEPECPVDAIKPDTEPGLEKWLLLNAEYAKIWPNITIKSCRSSSTCMPIRSHHGRRSWRAGLPKFSVPAAATEPRSRPFNVKSLVAHWSGAPWGRGSKQFQELHVPDTPRLDPPTPGRGQS